MAIHDWLAVLRKEYLQDFIKNGGATVKFVVPWEPGEHQALWEALGLISQEEGYAFTAVNAATTKIHMPGELAQRPAGQAFPLPTRGVLDCIVRSIFKNCGWAGQRSAATSSGIAPD